MIDENEEHGLRRVLGPIDATCIVVGAIVGVGIFFTPSKVARLAGSEELALLAWAIGGGIALLGALTFAELGGLYGRTGAQYEILRDSYGPLPAFLYVFCNATAIQAGAVAIIAIICSKYIGQAIGVDVTAPGPLIGLSAALIIGLTLANVVGVRWGSGIQNATVFAKLLTLVVVTIMATTVDAPPPPPPAAEAEPASSGAIGMTAIIFAALVPAFFSFGGWQHALWISGEIRSPRRNVPLAIVGGVLLVVVIYLAVNWAYLRLLGYEGVVGSRALAADAVGVVWSGAGPRVVAGAVAISAFGVLNAQLLSGPRLLHSMAADGRFFRPFARVSPKHHTPVAAILLMGAMALVLLLASGLVSVSRGGAAGEEALDLLLTGVVFIDGLFFALTGVALIVLRKKRPQASRSVRVPLYPIVPILFVLGEIGIIIGAHVDPAARVAAFIGAGWIVAAGLCYLLFFRRSP